MKKIIWLFVCIFLFGALLNQIAFISNNQKMPVYFGDLSDIPPHDRPHPYDLRHIVYPTFSEFKQANFYYISDYIPVGKDRRSIGDIIMELCFFIIVFISTLDWLNRRKKKK